MKTSYFVNHKTRMCRIHAGGGRAVAKDVERTLNEGFTEVTASEQDAFRAETRKALNAGWNPDGRISYAKFMERAK